MKSRHHLNTRLLPLSILISALIPAAVLAAPSVAIPNPPAGSRPHQPSTILCQCACDQPRASGNTD